jgi:hypothetical protein
MVALVGQSKHGPTVYADDPKREALAQAFYIRNGLDRGYRMTCHECGCYTVEGDGCMPVTYSQGACC